MVHDEQTQQQTEQGRRASQSLSAQYRHPPLDVAGYDIQRFLGAGAFGEVWVGVDRNTGRRVAIKFFNGRSKVDIALLSREVEKLVFLSTDRYVVQLLDVGWDAQPPYYVMDFIENGSLEDALIRDGNWSVRDTTELAQEIATGLSHLHHRGVLHCDLKPANVLLDDDRKPRLADFGQARLSSERSPALGTLFYMAPEQADLAAVPDTRWDVYSLGAILYRLLVGNPPYRCDDFLSELETTSNVSERLSRYRSMIENAPRPSAHRDVPGIDRYLVDIIDRCLAINPQQRFESAQSVLVALEQREDSLRRRPLVLLGFVAPLALLIAGAILGWGLYQNSVLETDAGLKAKAQESNRWAAQFAARGAADRIDVFFGSVESLVEDPLLLDQVEQLEENASFQQLATRLAHPRANDSRDPEVLNTRRNLIDSPARIPLQRWVEELLTRDHLPNVASWFVCDRQGVQIAAAFSSDEIQNTVGKCFAYRTYFTGLQSDLVSLETGSPYYLVSEPGEPREHITQAHLSAIFASQATGTWKIAFSTPIVRENQFLGILAATVDMGDFVEFDDQPAQFVMLVDGREGPNQGAILEHPLFDKYRREDRLLPVEFRQVRIPLDVLHQDYSELVDPLGTHPDGASFDRTWIAARRPVLRKLHPRQQRDEPERTATGLWVLALEDAGAIVAPAHDLGASFIQWGLLALSALVAIMLVVWLLVLRWLKQSRRRLERVLVPGGTARTSHDVMKPEAR